jgi:hypothetical protein
MLRKATCIAISVWLAACSARAEREEDAASSEAAASTFLEPSAYADLVTLSPSFPFGVVARHASSVGVLNARWGAHGGPLATLASGVVVRLPSSAEAESVSLAISAPTGLPSPHFWSVDGMVDLPASSGASAMRAYSSASSTFSGEVVFFGPDYASVVGRASVNGFYSGAFAGGGLVYSGLSGLAAAPSATVDNGLWFASGCPSACRATKLFGWTGFSGPVVTDANGVVFVSAFRTGEAVSDAVFGLTSVGHAAVRPTAIAEQNTQGTSSLVAVATPGASQGFIVAKGHDSEASAPSWGRAYRVVEGRVEGVGPIVADPIHAASDLVTTSFFADPRGHLWIAAESDAGMFLLELAPKP